MQTLTEKNDIFSYIDKALNNKALASKTERLEKEVAWLSSTALRVYFSLGISCGLALAIFSWFFYNNLPK